MDPTPSTPLTTTRIIARGLTRRCPVCGSRGTFTSWFTLAERCPRCNFPTTRVGDQWIGALGINTMVTFTTLVATIAIGFAITYPDPPFVPLVSAAVLVAAVLPVGFFPVSKSLWSAIDVAMRWVDPEDGVDPRHLPPRHRLR